MTQYYLTGCPSWRWYYPFHYAPYPSDLCAYLESLTTTEVTEIAPSGAITKANVKIELNFEEGEPLTPLQQLMAVLPPNRFVAALKYP